MHRTIIAGAVLLALTIPATGAYAKPAEEQQAGNEDGKNGSQQQPGKSHYPYDPHARGPYYGALVPPPQETFNQTYPVCTKEITDGCINANQLKRKQQQAEQQQEQAGEDKGGD